MATIQSPSNSSDCQVIAVNDIIDTWYNIIVYSTKLQEKDGVDNWIKIWDLCVLPKLDIYWYTILFLLLFEFIRISYNVKIELLENDIIILLSSWDKI